ncbi:dihydrodipicolinate synthase family protein [Variovorax saccharolyticus]|uniref:dihydrodipicolinate synthase family protein n=1 Tax=Variovorax saccharolyticus TaxID=3053516 RepID=UPI002577E776|nr:dihydrodipicolinate synthase family protein [Variovorax sp. J31P216]MDM0024877.1 dihydrodipicolinate synthase family protein [Variovorax sp. J31P216]
MPLQRSDLPAQVLDLLAAGTVIPAHPLALDAGRRFDRRRQRALTRYYVDAGAGGLAVGVHTTQFAIRERGLYETVLGAAIEDQRAWTGRPMAMIAGLCGPTAQARAEAQTAVGLGYHAGLLSLAAVATASEDELIAHCEAVSREIPLIGFYLQTVVGGPVLSSDFWRRFALLPNVLAIKVAPFNRYRTIDVVRALVDARAEERVFLYTGNDDHIVLDLALPFSAMRDGAPVTVRFRGGLLGHWSVWTSSAVAQLAQIKAELAANGGTLSPALLALDSRVTDCNAAFFDVANNFHGCIAGCHEVLRRQGLLEGIWCLDPQEGLGQGQAAEIDRVYRLHGDLGDDAFVRDNLARWLA